MRKAIILCLLFGGIAIGCGDDDNELEARGHDDDDDDRDAGEDVIGDGICNLAQCPEPDMGIACCAPNGACGFDPTGVGLACMANPGEGNVCELDECPLPSVGNACCTPFGTCGLDPFASNIFCFANPPFIPDPPDAGPGPQLCDPSECPDPEVGLPCCLPTNLCGVDTFSIGFCFGPPLEIDGGSQPIVPSTEPPDDPSVDGQCPSYLGILGPVWGCCSDYGSCGTFLGDQCLLPLGTPLSIDDDAGVPPGYLACTPPASPD